MGKLIVSWACLTKICREAKVEEALALITAMVRARREGWKNEEFETDCKGVIDKLEEDAEDDPQISTITKDIKRLKLSLDKCHFSFTKRENNYVSHRLAKFAVNLNFETVWKTDSPA